MTGNEIVMAAGMKPNLAYELFPKMVKKGFIFPRPTGTCGKGRGYTTFYSLTEKGRKEIDQRSTRKKIYKQFDEWSIEQLKDMLLRYQLVEELNAYEEEARKNFSLRYLEAIKNHSGADFIRHVEPLFQDEHERIKPFLMLPTAQTYDKSLIERLAMLKRHEAEKEALKDPAMLTDLLIMQGKENEELVKALLTPKP